MSDDELDPETRAIFAAFLRFCAEVEKRTFDNIVDSQPIEPEFFSPDGSPMPNYCHPAYEYARSQIERWLRGEIYSYDVMQLPVPLPPRLIYAHECEPVDLAPMQRHTFRRQQCAGPAPYVGDPFAYHWWVGVDENGRMVSADATIRYRNPAPAFSPSLSVLGVPVEPDSQ